MQRKVAGFARGCVGDNRKAFFPAAAVAVAVASLAPGADVVRAAPDTSTLSDDVGTVAFTVPTYVAQSQAVSSAGFVTGQAPGIAWQAPVLAAPVLVGLGMIRRKPKSVLSGPSASGKPSWHERNLGTEGACSC